MPMQRDAGTAANHHAWSDDFAQEFQDAFGHHPAELGGATARARAPHRPATAATALDQVTGDMHARLSDIEQRHATELRDLQIRLERMTGQAVRARTDIPEELSSAFARIEKGMAHLAGRMADAGPERRRANERFVFGTAKPEATHFVFNAKPRVPVAPVDLDPPGGHDPWDAEQVEALVNIYESGAAGYGQPDKATLMAQASARALAMSGPKSLAETRAEDRSWLEERLSGFSENVTKSIEAARPSAALTTLMDRVDALESRFSSTLGSLASKSDLEDLRKAANTASPLPEKLAGLEAQIKDLATHIDSTHKHLSRLDAIERHLGDLQAFAQASIDASPDADVFAPSTPAPTAEEIANLAELAVERALAKLPSAPHVAADPEAAMARAETEKRIEAVHGLLNEFASERRKGDQYTTGMLETVQEALISLIDRVDQIEARKSTGLSAATAPSHEKTAEAPGDAKAPSRRRAAEPDAAAPAKPYTHQNVDISEIKINPRRAPGQVQSQSPGQRAEESPADNATSLDAIAQDPSAPELHAPDLDTKLAAGEAALAATTEKRKLRNVAAQAVAPPSEPVAPANLKGRVLKLAGFVAGLVAIVLIASIFLADRFGPSSTPVSPASAPPLAPANQKVAPVPRLNKLPGDAPAPGPAATEPVQPGSPPGMVGPPLRAPAPVQKLTPERSNSALQASPTADDINEQMRPRKPASMPETVNDDISLLDNDEPMRDALPSAAEASAQPPALPTPRRTATTQVMPGVALDRGPAANQPDPRTTQPPRAAVPQATSTIVTGSNPGPVARTQVLAQVAPPSAPVSAQPQAQRAPVAGEAPAERFEMPAAQVGPQSLRQAAASGDPSAAFEVATRLAEGRGIKQDFQQAHIWYQRSASKGFAVAQYRLGTLYERGLGVAADPARAKAWYKRAADQGNIKAMHNMAVLTAGSGGNAPDYEGAAKWFRAAADHGLADSQYNLGVLNEGGLGVTRDIRAAYYWFALAARGGDAEAAKRRDAAMAQLDPAIQRATDDQIRVWRTKPNDPKINDARVAGDQWRQAAVPSGELPPPVQALQRAAQQPPVGSQGQPPQLPQAPALFQGHVQPQPIGQTQPQPAAQAVDTAPLGIKVYPR